jgi:hypothetical protein
MTPPTKTDTTPAAARAQAEALRRLLPARRLALAVDMSLTARALLAARLRAEHPAWSETAVRDQCLRLAFPTILLPPLPQ